MNRSLVKLRNRSYLLFAVALLLTSCHNGPTAPDPYTVEIDGMQWTYLGLQEESVWALEPSPWGLFAGTLDSGVLRLDSSTGHWVSAGLNVAHGMVVALLLTHTDPPRLLSAIGAKVDTAGTGDTEAAVYATEDGGRSWKPWDGGLDAGAALKGNDAWAYSLAADPCNADRLFMGLYYSVLRSDDGGRTWTYVLGDEIGGAMGEHAIAISPDCDGHVWAGGQAGFFAAMVHRSSDWGDTWEHWVGSGRDDAVWALSVDPANPERLLAGMESHVDRSDDGGANWQTVLLTERISRVHGLERLGGIVYAVAAEELPLQPPDYELRYVLGFYRSGDGGTTWDTLQVPEQSAGGTSLAVDAQGRLLIGTWNGVWRVKP